MTRKCVQVHASRLPQGTSRNRGPLRRAEIQCSQHLERHVRYFTRLVHVLEFEQFKLTRDFRHRIESVIATDEVTEQRFTCRGRGRGGGRRRGGRRRGGRARGRRRQR